MSKVDRAAAWASVSPASAADVFAPAPLQAQTVVFFAVNATGVGPADRPVSLGAVKLSLKPPGEIAFLHLVFDPEIEGVPEAARRHGYAAQELKLQDSFESYARPLAQWLAPADLRIADTALELRLLREALARAGVAADQPERNLRAYDFYGEQPPTLDAMAAQLQLVRNPRHGALRDAWLCMQTFLWIHGLPWQFDYALTGDPTPSNYRAAPRPVWASLSGQTR